MSNEDYNLKTEGEIEISDADVDGDQHQRKSGEELFNQEGQYSLTGEDGVITGEADVTPLSITEADQAHDYMIRFTGTPRITNEPDVGVSQVVSGQESPGQQEYHSGSPTSERPSKAMTPTEENSRREAIFSREYPQSMPYAVALTLLVFSVPLSSPPLALIGSLVLLTTKLHYGN